MMRLRGGGSREEEDVHIHTPWIYGEGEKGGVAV